MKKLTLIILALALLMGLSQCTKQRPEMPSYTGSVGGRIIQNVTVNTTRGDNGGDSKVSYVSLDKELKLQWDEDDVIYVYDGNSMCGTLSFKDYVGEDHSKATFTGNISPLEGSKLRFYLFNNVAEADVPGFGGNDVILSRDYATQNAKQITDIISGLVLRSDEIDISPDGKYDGIMMKIPYAVVRVNFKNFGSGDITVRGMSSTGFSIAKTGVLTMNETTSAKLTAPGTDDFFTVLMPITSSHYTFGNTVGYAKTVNPWTLNENTYYTKSGSASGEAVVITGDTPGDTPTSVTTTVGCSGSIYAMGGKVTLPSGKAQQVEYGLVYSEADTEPVPEIGKAGCTTVVGGTESFPAGKETSFTVDITGLTPGVTYNVRAYAIGENGYVVYANSETGIKTVVGGDSPQAVNWNGGGIQGASPKVFTVGKGDDGVAGTSDDVKVRFSQGNLQYVGRASTPYWKFADHQFDFLGKTTGQDSESQTVDRDLFGWGTSGVTGYTPIANCVAPWSTSDRSSDYYAYGAYTNNLNDGGDNKGKADWGYNAIYVGSNETTGWRTLKTAEWDYLIKTRTNAANLYGHGKVGGCTSGLIILPDDWTWTGDVASFQSSWVSGNSDWSNVYSYTNWSRMESAGAVFLPAAGYRNETSVYIVSYGLYWSSSYDSNSAARSLYFLSGNVSPQYSGYSRYNGFSVRLVR